MTASLATRFAGKALADFLKVAGGAAAGAAQQAALGYLLKTPEAADAPGARGRLAAGLASLPPEATSKLVGAAAPVAIAGGLIGAGALLSSRQQSGYSLPVQAQAQLPVQRQSPFATQQFVPGNSPLTNEQMGEALLDQQRFQHQLELISARQATAAGSGGLLGGAGIQDIMGMAQKIYG
jgi:hypothetical protein